VEEEEEEEEAAAAAAEGGVAEGPRGVVVTPAPSTGRVARMGLVSRSGNITLSRRRASAGGSPSRFTSV